MLSCNVGKTNVNTIDYDEKQLRAWSKKKILKCPVCGEVLVYKHGLVKIPHFAHEKDSECTYTFYENETKEHCQGKVLLYKWLKELEFVSNLELEFYIKETKQRPDLYFELDNKRYVIEYQCSPITLKEYKERKELYRLNDIIDIWVLGMENFNFNPSTGKIKMKVLDGTLFSQEKLYYLDAFNEIIYNVYSSFEYVKDFYNIRKHNINNTDNFYIKDSEIILNETIYDNFRLKLVKYLKDIENNKKLEYEKLLSKQLLIYKQIKLKIEEDKQIELNNKIKELIKDKEIYLYDGFGKLIITRKKHNFNYITYSEKMLYNKWLLNDLYKSYKEKFLENELHILMDRWDFNKRYIRHFLIECFSNNKVIFVERS